MSAISKKFFITGTDTEVGKTYITIGLLKKFNKLSFTTIGIKPVASGGFYDNGKILNNDALQLQQHSSLLVEYNQTNPYSFIPAISPNIASDYLGTSLTVENIFKKISPIFNLGADICIIEGIGGWHTPLNNNETMADFVVKCNIPVILVIGIKLGCLNHAILTVNVIKNAGVCLQGWIANCLDPSMIAKSGCIATLKNYIKAPCLGIVDYNQHPEEVIQEFFTHDYFKTCKKI